MSYVGNFLLAQGSNSKYISILSLGGGLPVREWIKPSFFQRSVDPHCAVSTSLSPVQTLLCTQLARKPFCPVALQRPRVWPGSKQDETNPRRTKAHQCTGASCYYMQAAERAGAALLCTRCACYLLLQVSTSMTESKVLPWTLPGSSYREQRMAHGCNTMNQKVHTESNKGEEAKIKINLKINFRTKLTVRAFYLSPSTSPLGPCAEETEVRPGFHTTAGDAAWRGWLWRKLPRSRVSIKTPEADPKVSWITLAAAYCCFGFWLFGSQPMLTANDLSDRMSLFLKCFLLVYWLF